MNHKSNHLRQSFTKFEFQTGHGMLRQVLLFCIVFFVTALVCQAQEDLQTRIEAVTSELNQELTDVAKWCDENKLEDPAKITRQWIEAKSPLLMFYPRLPQQPRTVAPEDTAEIIKTWLNKFYAARDKAAEKYFQLGREAQKAKKASLAFQLILEAAHQNSDHPEARRLLGYKNYKGEWLTQFEISQRAKKLIWHKQYGWILEAHLKRYEAGERFIRGKGFVTAAEDAAYHSQIEKGWKIRTEHFEVTTNHSLEEGVKLAAELEEIYRVWMVTFVDFYLPANRLSALFSGRSSYATSSKPHQVWYFRTRDEYNNHLRHSITVDIGITYGIYLGDTEKAYFFAGDEQDPTTLVHEATHQLFSETNPTVRRIGKSNNFWNRKQANFWIVEGISCYMESFQPRNHGYTLGGFDNARMKAARYRLLKDNYYVPFKELTSHSMRTLQQDPNIAKLYSQSTGITSFLMHYDHGRYRDALIQYLFAVYTGKDDADSLAEIIGVPFTTLDKQYREYMSQNIEE